MPRKPRQSAAVLVGSSPRALSVMLEGGEQVHLTDRRRPPSQPRSKSMSKFHCLEEFTWKEVRTTQPGLQPPACLSPVLGSAACTCSLALGSGALLDGGGPPQVCTHIDSRVLSALSTWTAYPHSPFGTHLKCHLI